MDKEKFKITFKNAEDRSDFLNFINQEYENEMKEKSLIVESNYESYFLGEAVTDIILIVTSIWSILFPILKYYKEKRKKKIQKIINLTTGEIIEKIVIEEEI